MTMATPIPLAPATTASIGGHHPEDLAKLLKSGKVAEFNRIMEGRGRTHLALPLGLDLRDKTLAHVDLRGLDLTGAVFDRCDLQSANFTSADLRGASFKGANLRAAQFSDAKMPEVNLEGAAVGYADFTRAIMNGARLPDLNCEHTVFSGAHLEEAFLVGIKCHKDTSFFRANLSAADCQNAVFLGSNLCQCQLTRCDLRGASLRADLTGADFHETLLLGTVFDQAVLLQAKRLTPAQIASTIGFESAQLDPGRVADALSIMIKDVTKENAALLGLIIDLTRKNSELLERNNDLLERNSTLVQQMSTKTTINSQVTAEATSAIRDHMATKNK